MCGVLICINKKTGVNLQQFGEALDMQSHRGPDDRGVFYETFNLSKFREITGIEDVSFFQDNESVSKINVLRGLHFQNPPYAQGKLVRVSKGRALDVAVDIRKGSPTYGKYFSVELSAENKKMFWIPPGFAHGFVTLENDTIFCYKCTAPYSKESEGAILWNDSQLNINWGIDNPILSEKDQEAELFKYFKSPF